MPHYQLNDLLDTRRKALNHITIATLDSDDDKIFVALCPLTSLVASRRCDAFLQILLQSLPLHPNSNPETRVVDNRQRPHPSFFRPTSLHVNIFQRMRTSVNPQEDAPRIAGDSSNTMKGIICGLISALIWGAFPVITRLGIEHTTLDKYDITAIRYGVSGLILLPFLLRQGLMGVKWKAIILMVIGIGSPYMLVVAQGLTYAPVENFAVITPGSMIVFSVIASTIIFKSRLASSELAGVIIILAGIMLIGFDGLQAKNLMIYCIFIFGGLLWSIYTVVTKIYSVKPFHATAIVSVFSMVIYLPFYFYFNGLRILAAPLHDVFIQAVYQGILVSIIALFFYSKAIYYLGPSKGSVFAAFVPGAAIVLASFILGELPGKTSIIGLCIVTAGMLLSLVRRNR